MTICFIGAPKYIGILLFTMMFKFLVQLKFVGQILWSYQISRFQLKHFNRPVLF